ncbi:hypothetical protein LJC39_03515 [Parabacteroides sp. OttesenSCG-928-B22]|nr:hypothetical protein [Parabacteroides sp. OttesenSCG-928-B22]
MGELFCKELLNDYIEKLPVGVSSTTKETIVTSANTLILAKGKTMFCGGHRKNMLYRILKGGCVRYVTNQHGEEKAIMFHTEEHIPAFGAPFTRMEGAAVNSIIKASENLFLLEMNKSTEKALACQDHVYAIYVIDTYLDAIARLNQFNNHLLGLSKSDILAWLLKEYSYIFQRFPSKDIANFIGISPVWLSNLKRKMTS